jgi:hypothetical protein
MRRLVSSGAVLGLLCAATLARGQAPNVVTRESTVTATVDRIERSSRLVTVRLPQNAIHTVYVDPSLTVFDELQTGDVVTLKYAESVVVQVRPDAKLSDVRDTTEEAQKAGNAQVVQQLKAVVTIERIDPQGLSVEYRSADGSKVLRPVTDKRLLQGLHEGDRVEVTLTRERAVSIERVRR